VRIELLTRQPTMRRANTSMTKATYSQPCQVETSAQVADPQLVRPLGPELLVDPVQRARRLGIPVGGANDLASPDTAQTQFAHQALDRAASHQHALTSQLTPDLLDAIDLHVGPPDALYLGNQHIISTNPCAALVRLSLQGSMPPIR
jgi:hypothetical protein